MDVKGRLVEMSAGVYVESDVLNVVEKIKAYDPNLRVKYLAQHGQVTDAPYALFELCKDGVERLVFNIWTLDNTVLERVRAADNAVNNVLHVVDANNASVKHQLNQRFQEKLAEGSDIVVSYLKSPKGRWTFSSESGKLVQLDDSTNAKNGVIDAGK